MTVAAAIVAVVLLGAVTAFQAALALGTPWGSTAWGGQHSGVLPTRLRIASGVAALIIYPFAIFAVLAASGLFDRGWLPVDEKLVMWGLAGLLGLGAVANFVSRSRPERLWGPVALAIAVCCAIIAIG